MGMTDRQFDCFLRLLLDSLTDVERETDEKKKAERLRRVIQNLQDTLDD